MDQAPEFAPEDWYNPWYEVCIEFQPRRDDARLGRAVAALWSSPLLDGPWDGQGYRQRMDPRASRPFESEREYGLLRLPGRPPIGCFLLGIREMTAEELEFEPDPDELPCADWLELIIPVAMLERAFPVYGDLGLKVRANPWLEELHGYLLQLVEAVYAVAPFNLALIGIARSGDLSEYTVSAEDAEFGGIVASPGLNARIQPVSRAPVVLASGLCWYPYTEGTIGISFSIPPAFF
jgi:hypothetical protein